MCIFNSRGGIFTREECYTKIIEEWTRLLSPNKVPKGINSAAALRHLHETVYRGIK